MMEAPMMVWVQWPQPNGTGLAFTCQARPPALRTTYILATPSALAASPEVQALIREAEAQGMEQAIGAVHLSLVSNPRHDDARRIAKAAIRAARAAIKGDDK